MDIYSTATACIRDELLHPSVHFAKSHSLGLCFVSLFFIFSCHNSGSFSKIYLCNNREDSGQENYVAIKEINTRELSIPQIRSIRYEINILSQLQKHRNIITLESVHTYKGHIYMVCIVMMFNEAL